jgi:serine/threonine protein kinase
VNKDETPRKAPAKPTIGRFTLTRKIGSSGQGSAYLAEDPTLKRAVAIKLIDKESISGELRPGEAVIAVRLQHPHIVAIHDAGHYHQRPYLVFEFVNGRTFREILNNDGPIEADQALVFMPSVLEGMSHAHQREVLHLDLSPNNILLNDRQVAQIMDFGLTRLTNAIPDVTTVPVGTLLYMAPEQLDEKVPTPRTDLRSLGLILYEMLTGSSAITARSIHSAALEIINDDIDLAVIDALDNMTPICESLASALAGNADKRYADATQMLTAFDMAIKTRDEDAAANVEPAQGTVEFLLRRMQRREDFQALSGSLVEIKRLTTDNSTATTAQLANVVLRDYALTNKLLKLANSSFYGVIAGEVRSISHAIRLIGFEQLRVTTNSRTLFSHIRIAVSPLRSARC